MKSRPRRWPVAVVPSLRRSRRCRRRQHRLVPRWCRCYPNAACHQWRELHRHPYIHCCLVGPYVPFAWSWFLRAKIKPKRLWGLWSLVQIDIEYRMEIVWMRIDRSLEMFVAGIYCTVYEIDTASTTKVTVVMMFVVDLTICFFIHLPRLPSSPISIDHLDSLVWCS